MLAALLTLLLMLNCTLISAFAVSSSGACGPDATWSYDTQTATLTISGSGAIDSYEQLAAINGKLGTTPPAPWKSYINDIRTITIGEGITSIGENAFKYCDNLKEINLPSSLSEIKNFAFTKCSSLERVIIPKNVQRIGCNVFLGRGDETKPYVYFLGNAPSAKSSGTSGRSFSDNTTLYYLSGNSGWYGSSWSGYLTKTWNGTDFLDPLFEGGGEASPGDNNWDTAWTPPTSESNWTLNAADDYGKQVEVSGISYYSYAYDVIESVNALRRQNGLHELSIDDKLMKIAMQRAAECSIYYSHTRPNDTSCLELFPSAAVRGENIAAGQSSSAAVMSDWSNSPGHYANMVNSDYTSIGVGCFYIDGTYYWAQAFTSGPPTSHTKVGNLNSTVLVSVSSNHFILQSNSQLITVKIGETVQLPIKLINTGHYNSPTSIYAATSDCSYPSIITLSTQPLAITGKQPGSGSVTVKFENGMSTSYNICVASPYNDVLESDWYYDSVTWATSNSLVNGVSQSIFGASLPMSRGMTADFLYRLEGSPAVSWTSLFSDVNSNHTTAINWVASCGLMSGYGNNKFGPTDTLTREQMATILYRYAQYKGIDTSQKADISRFSDSVDVSRYALDAMRWANGEGLVNGTSKTKLSPSKTITKAEAATIFMRFCEKFNLS